MTVDRPRQPRKVRVSKPAAPTHVVGTGRRPDGMTVTLYCNESALNFCRVCGRQLLLTEVYTLAVVGGQGEAPVCKTCRPWERMA